MDVVDRQFEILMKEIELIDGKVTQSEELRGRIKNWSIVLWSGAVGLALTRPEFKEALWLTALIPALFCFLEAVHVRHQWAYEVRRGEMRDFINSEAFLRWMHKKTELSIDMLIFRSKSQDQYRDFWALPKIPIRTKECKDKKKRLAEWWKLTNRLRRRWWIGNIFSRTVGLVYAGMVLISLLLWCSLSEPINAAGGVE
jgi:hypothetical protein